MSFPNAGTNWVNLTPIVGSFWGEQMASIMCAAGATTALSSSTHFRISTLAGTSPLSVLNTGYYWDFFGTSSREIWEPASDQDLLNYYWYNYGSICKEYATLSSATLGSWISSVGMQTNWSSTNYQTSVATSVTLRASDFTETSYYLAFNLGFYPSVTRFSTSLSNGTRQFTEQIWLFDDRPSFYDIMTWYAKYGSFATPYRWIGGTGAWVYVNTVYGIYNFMAIRVNNTSYGSIATIVYRGTFNAGGMGYVYSIRPMGSWQSYGPGTNDGVSGECTIMNYTPEDWGTSSQNWGLDPGDVFEATFYFIFA
jgi:hypothetical protein